jgi:CubicO group peptidase (beta-lactamase class C family)
LSGNEVVKGELGSKLDKYLSRITPFGFSGACLVAKNKDVLINKGYGMAIREKRIRNTSDTVFCTGSITKQFTAAAIMTLEMKDKLNTADPISKYFANVPADKKDITIHNLLTHTSGVITDAGDDYVIAYREETIKKILNSPLLFASGTQYEYSNAGYTVLAAIIELVSRQPYETYLNEHLFNPSGMTFTGFNIPNWKERVVANWYAKEVNNGTPPIDQPGSHWNVMGNGEILSTTEDMHKWYLTLKGNAILSAEAKKKLFTPFLNNYAYGWNITETEHGTRIQHDGGSTLGSSAQFKWFENQDVVIVLFANQSYGDAIMMPLIQDKIEKLVFDGDVEIPFATLESEPSHLRRFVGTYRLTSGDSVNFSVETNILKLTAVGQDAISAIFLPEQDSLAFNEPNMRSARLFETMVKGDFSYLEDVVENKETIEPKRRWLTRKLEELGQTGKVAEVKVLGSFPSARREGVVETVTQVKFGENVVRFGALWHGEKLWGFPGSTMEPFMFFNPISEYTFAGYHLGLARGVLVEFHVDENGSVKELIIKRKSGSLKAQKIA